MNDMTEVKPGDELSGLMRAARDSVTDDMIARLTESAAQAMDLLDRGDLERITRYARVAGAAEDAVTDDMIGRFATLAGEATMMVDRMNSSGVMKLIDLLGQLNGTGALDRIAAKLPALVDNLELIENMLGCMQEASREVKEAPAPGGGILPLLAMMRDPENQKALQFFMAVGRRMRQACTKG